MHLTAKGKAVFHAEKLAPQMVRPPHQGLRGWFERKVQRIKTAWAEANHGATGKVRALWDNLQNRMPDDEGMLIRLRDASELQIHHPPAITGEEAQTLWVDYMARCRRRHLPWFVVNALLAPVSVLLAPFPGPNLIGYWFLYRGVRDLLALLGLRHARDPRTVTTYHPIEVPALTGPSGTLTGLSGTNVAPFTRLATGGLP